MKSTKPKKQSKMVRFLAAPFKMLNKLYMAGVSSCAAGMDHHAGTANLYGGPQVTQLPRNFSVSSSKGSNEEDDFKELIRVVSTRLNAGVPTKVNNGFTQVLERRHGGMSMEVGRSYSVGIGQIGKIDEDEPCDFKEGDITVVTYPRCRSVYGLAKRNYSVQNNNVYQHEKSY